MLRRDALKSVAAWLTAAGSIRTGTRETHDTRDTKEHAAQPPKPMPPAVRSPTTTARPRPPFIEAADGTRLFYRDWGAEGTAGTEGSNKGQPVVFAAPWAMTVDWFEYQMTHLASHGLRCIGYDRRGHGRSDEPGRGYDFATLTSDLATLIARLDLQKITLVGHSMGAGEVVRYLSRYGAARVSRLVLIAPITPFALKTPDNPDGGERSVIEAGRAKLSHDRPGQIAQAAPAFFGTDVNTVSPAMLQWWIDMVLEQCSLKVMVDLHRMFTETDFRPDLRTITIPTLIVHGDRDTSTSLEKNGRRTAGMIAGSRLVVYEGAAHALPITHMDRLNAELLAFAKSSSSV
jgi:non-heme chloroperoxidase